MHSNAVSYTNPGYTRLNELGKRNGTMLIKLRSNDSIECEFASVLTLPGLMRASMGAAIKVRLRGVAGLRDSAMTATAARTAGPPGATTPACAPTPVTYMQLRSNVSEMSHTVTTTTARAL